MTSLYNFLRWYFVLEDFPSSKKEDIRNHLLSVRKIFLALTIICFACCLCLLIYSWKAALTFLFIGNLFIACICLYGFSSRLRQIGLSFDMKTAEIQKLNPKIFFKRVYHEAVTTFLLFLIVFWSYWGFTRFFEKSEKLFPTLLSGKLILLAVLGGAFMTLFYLTVNLILYHRAMKKKKSS